MACARCNKETMELNNSYPYAKILVEYYKCKNCGHEYSVTYPDKDTPYEK